MNANVPEQTTLSEYEIIGATLKADENELPMRLRPILRTRREPRAYALLYESEEGEHLVPEDEAYIEEMFDEERFHRFDLALPALPAHWLVQFTAGQTPEYLPRVDAIRQIREIGECALERSERALGEGNLGEARKQIACAARALEDDPLPRLAVIALWNDDIDESQRAYLLTPLQQYTAEHVQRRFREVRYKCAFPNLIDRICADEVNDHYELEPGWPRLIQAAEGRAD